MSLKSAFLVLFLLAAVSGGCSSVAQSTVASKEAVEEPNFVPCALGFPPLAGRAGEHYIVRPGDELLVSFYMSPEFDRDITVQPDGKINLQVAGAMSLAGLTLAQVEQAINQAYERELRDPQATVVVKNSPSWVVYVAGEVAHPGAVPLMPEMTAMEAISAAGGFTDSAGTNNVILIRRDYCGNPHGEMLNLGKVIRQTDLEQDAGVLPSDVIVVPKSGVANLALIVKQYVRDLMPVQPYLSIPVY